MIHELDQDTALETLGEGRFAARVSDRWGIFGVPNGGYLAVLLARALARSLPHPDPVTMTTHYLSPPRAGPAEIEVEVMRTGRGHATGAARLVQEGVERLRCLATFGDLGASEGPTREDGAPPPIPPMDACEVRTMPPGASTFVDRVDERYAPGSLDFLSGKMGGPMEISGWIRLADGRPPDALSLLLFADSMPPPAFHAFASTWVPTLELTVHVRRRPSPGWLRCLFKTRFLIDGYLEEDGELWDDAGRLVAMSRQLARFQRR